MTLRILTDDELESKGITALIWGREGVGKSSLAAEMQAPLYINVENKVPPMIRARVEANGGQFAIIDELGDLNQLYNDLMAGKDVLGFKPQSLVIDSMTELTDMHVDDLEDSPKMRAKDGDKDGYKVYRTSLKDVLNLVRGFKVLGLPTLMTALEKYRQDDRMRYNYMAAVPGKLATEGRLPAAVDISARYIARGEDSAYHTLHMVSGKDFSAKAPKGVPKKIEVKNDEPETLLATLQQLGLRR